MIFPKTIKVVPYSMSSSSLSSCYQTGSRTCFIFYIPKVIVTFHYKVEVTISVLKFRALWTKLVLQQRTIKHLFQSCLVCETILAIHSVLSLLFYSGPLHFAKKKHVQRLAHPCVYRQGYQVNGASLFTRELCQPIYRLRQAAAGWPILGKAMIP